MQYLATLILATALLTAPAQSTVQTFRAHSYRAAPLTSFNAPSADAPLQPAMVTTLPPPSSTTAQFSPSLPQPVAQKREGQGQTQYYYAAPDPGVAPVGTQVVQTVPIDQQQQLQLQAQKYPNYYYPQHTGGQLQPMGYQAFDTEGQAPSQGGAVSSGGSSNYLSNFPWVDVLVYAAAIGLVGSGSYLWYYQIVAKDKSGRALKEFVEQLKSDETARMAKQVFDSIRKFSKLNNENSE